MGSRQAYGRTIEWHQVRRGLWIATASHPDYLGGTYSNTERGIRRVARGIEESLRLEQERVARVWPMVEAQLAAILGVNA